MCAMEGAEVPCGERQRKELLALMGESEKACGRGRAW